MNLSEFQSQISRNLRRGTSLDDLIPQWVRQAALWIERNHTLSYMKRFAEISINPADTDTPRFVELADTNIKAIHFFRWVQDDGSYLYMTQKDPRDFPSLEVGVPAFYYPNGTSSLVLSATPESTLNGEIWASRYSAWPTNGDATHWLIEWAEDVLEARAMINAAKHLRDQGMKATWKENFDDGLVGLYAADSEFELENSDLRMEYYGEGVVQG